MDKAFRSVFADPPFSDEPVVLVSVLKDVIYEIIDQSFLFTQTTKAFAIEFDYPASPCTEPKIASFISPDAADIVT